MKPKIYWGKFKSSVRLFLLHDLDGASVRDGARIIGIDKSALQRALSGKPISADNYAHLCMWLGCPVGKFLNTAKSSHGVGK